MKKLAAIVSVVVSVAGQAFAGTDLVCSGTYVKELSTPYMEVEESLALDLPISLSFIQNKMVITSANSRATWLNTANACKWNDETIVHGSMFNRFKTRIIHQLPETCAKVSEWPFITLAGNVGTLQLQYGNYGKLIFNLDCR